MKGGVETRWPPSEILTHLQLPFPVPPREGAGRRGRDRRAEGKEQGRKAEKGRAKPTSGGFPGGAVVENLPANAGDTGSSPSLGRSHMPRSN